MQDLISTLLELDVSLTVLGESRGAPHSRGRRMIAPSLLMQVLLVETVIARTFGTILDRYIGTC